MQDYSTRSKHFRALANMVGTTFGQWAIFPLVEEVITHSTEGEGILSKDKIRYKISDYMLDLYRRYLSQLKPIGGSFAGAKRPSTSSTAATRASTSASAAQDLVDDPTGDSNLQQVIKDLIAEQRLDEREAQTVHSAAAYFKLILEKILEDPVFGLRRNANKFHSFQVSNRDAFQIMDDILQELHPLEILMTGPEVTMLQEFNHATSTSASLRIDDIAKWRDVLHKTFRTSTTRTDMSDSQLMDRRPHLQHLVYLTSPSFEHRLRTRNTNGNTIFHAARSEVQAIINMVVMNKNLTGSQIVAELRPILKLHSGTNLTTINWRGLASRGRDHSAHHIDAHRSVHEDTNSDHRRHANVSRFSRNDDETKAHREHRADQRPRPHRQDRRQPRSHPAQSQGNPKAGTRCRDCGQEGHWARDPECPHSKDHNRAPQNHHTSNTKTPRDSKTVHWSRSSPK